jgi:HlyD family secretion protein
VQLTYATVTAPQAGVVSAVAANAGQNASPGKTIATISDTNDLFVRVFVPETRIGDVKIGAAATVKTDSSDATYPGTVEFIASKAEFTPNNVETKEQRVKLVYEVRVRLNDTSGVLKAGMPVDVTF